MSTDEPGISDATRTWTCGGHAKGPLSPVLIEFTNSLALGPQPELLTRVRDSIACHGYAYITGVPTTFDHYAFLASLGVPLPQYDGELIWDLFPEEGMDAVYHSRNRQPLVPHTEYYEWPGLPPHFVALWCVRPAKEGGETLLADGGMFLKELTAAQRAVLCRPQRWQSSEGLRQKGMGFEGTHPMLEDIDGKPVLRYSHNNMIRGADPDVSELFESFAEFFESHKIAITIEERGLLVWDNHRMLHSRSGYDDRRRHLRRVLLR